MSKTAKLNPRSPEAIIEQQRRDAAANKAAAEARKQATAVAKTEVPALVPAVAVPDNRTPVQRYVDEVSPAFGIVGRLTKFAKEGTFVYADDDEPVDGDADFAALCGEVLIGWIKFPEKEGEPPLRIQGLLYDGFVMPHRDSLGDMDQTKWEIGLSGQPEDPWKHQMCLPLQNTATKELITFGTTSKTGRRAVGNLLRHYDRMQRRGSDEVPVVRMKAGGFQHKDPRVGWVATPAFAIVGRVPRDTAAVPDTSVSADLNDAIPHM